MTYKVDCMDSIEDILNQDLHKRELRMLSKLDYYNRTYKGLSYSRVEMKLACSRKFEIAAKYRLMPRTESATFAYGHAVGAGVQYTIAGRTFNHVMLQVLFNYDYPFDKLGTASEQRSKKSYWHALDTVEMFYKAYTSGQMPYLAGWEVAKFKNANGDILPAVELTFVIDMGDGWTYEGHIDLVLYNPVTNRYMVLELKTTGGKVVDEATYSNSDQAVGYGVVIDTIAGNLSASASFDVLYLVNKTVDQVFLPFLFTKKPSDKAAWLFKLLIQREEVERYEAYGFYPPNGQSCMDYYRRCEYYTHCKRDNSELEAISNNVANLDTVTYTKLETPTFIYTIEEVMERQRVLENYAYGVDTETDMLLNVTTVSQ
jgi:hypothetical protein